MFILQQPVASQFHHTLRELSFRFCFSFHFHTSSSNCWRSTFFILLVAAEIEIIHSLLDEVEAYNEAGSQRGSNIARDVFFCFRRLPAENLFFFEIAIFFSFCTRKHLILSTRLVPLKASLRVSCRVDEQFACHHLKKQHTIHLATKKDFDNLLTRLNHHKSFMHRRSGRAHVKAAVGVFAHIWALANGDEFVLFEWWESGAHDICMMWTHLC